MAFTPRAPVLPPGVLVDVSGEEGDVARVDEKLAFDVDENLHIVVDHPERFSEVDEIEFWVSKGRGPLYIGGLEIVCVCVCGRVYMYVCVCVCVCVRERAVSYTHLTLPTRR